MVGQSKISIAKEVFFKKNPNSELECEVLHNQKVRFGHEFFVTFRDTWSAGGIDEWWKRFCIWLWIEYSGIKLQEFFFKSR